MRLHSLASHPRTIQLGLTLGRHVPRRLAYAVSSWLATAISRLRPEVYQALCANLAQVLGPEAEAGVLAKTARRVFVHFIRGYYDLFRAMSLGPEELQARVDISATLLAAVQASQEQGRGLVLAMTHLGNFDLASQLVSRYSDRVQALTLPDPPAGFVSLNAMRAQGGTLITPLSPAALRQGIRTLREGGILGVAPDRVITDLDDLVPFFGRPAHVPSGHVRLALHTNAQVLVGACPFLPETGRYLAHVEPPLDMIYTGDKEEEVALNMRRVLDATERLIRRWADQWMMFVPVWPELPESEEAPCAS